MTESTYYIKAKGLIDGSGSGVLDEPILKVSNGIISDIGIGKDNRPCDFPLYDFPFSYIIPGLIDSHVHLALGGDCHSSYSEYLEQSNRVLQFIGLRNIFLHFAQGVTTVRDCGGREDVILALKNILSKNTIGPSLLVSGRPITKKGGHLSCCMGEVTNTDDIRYLVQKLIEVDVDFIKVMASGGGGCRVYEPSFTAKEINLIVKEAHSMGKLVSTHCTCIEAIKNSIEAGVDIIEHAGFFDENGVHSFQKDIAKEIAQAGIYVCPTLGFRTPDGTAFEQYTPVKNLSLLLEYGVQVIGGSDSGSTDTYFGNIYREIYLMAKSGMKPLEVINAWTGLAAQAMRLSNIGLIKQGYTANLVLIGGNPAEDIEAFRRIHTVIYKGLLFPQGGI